MPALEEGSYLGKGQDRSWRFVLPGLTSAHLTLPFPATMAPAQASEVWAGRRWLVSCILLSLIMALAATIYFDWSHRSESVFDLANLVGPSVQSMLTHRGDMTVCIDAAAKGSVLCFHAGRMPMAEWVVASLTLIFGNHMLPVALAKMMLFLLPLWLAMAIVWRSMAYQRQGDLSLASRVCVLVLLAAPFLATPFLADVVNLQVEEGYSYSCLALATALLLFSSMWVERGRARWPVLLLFVLSLDALFLSKSSTVLSVLVLLAFGLRRIRWRPQQVILVAAVLLTPLGWGLHVQRVSHHFSIGTSIDGINFHKGNNPAFLERYPPPPGDTLDRYDVELDGKRHFDDEWQYDALHRSAALHFIAQHPADDIRGWWRKLDVLLFSFHKTGSSKSSGRGAFIETAGVISMRLMIWAACLLWIGRAVMELRAGRRVDLLWPAIMLSCLAPYLAGFGYTRHASVLMYPAALLLCRHVLSVHEGRVNRDSIRYA